MSSQVSKDSNRNNDDGNHGEQEEETFAAPK